MNRKITRAKAALTGVFLSLFLQFAEISLMTFGVFFVGLCFGGCEIFLFVFLLTPRMT